MREVGLDSLLQVPIDVTVEEPRARVVSEEPDRDVISATAHAHDVADDRIVEVVRRVSGTADDMKGVPVQVHRVLMKKVESPR